MEWVTDYWYVLVLGLVVAMVLLGFKTKDNESENIPGNQKGSQKDEKEHKSGHSCCH